MQMENYSFCHIFTIVIVGRIIKDIFKIAVQVALQISDQSSRPSGLI